jgi:hypothetical protein
MKHSIGYNPLFNFFHTSRLRSAGFVYILFLMILNNNNGFGQTVNCGIVNTLYQTIGGTSTADIYRYNRFLNQYIKIGELQGASNTSASNSAYSAATGYIYSANSNGTVFNVYDPSNNFSLIGTVNITGNTKVSNNTLFAIGDSVGFITVVLL